MYFLKSSSRSLIIFFCVWLGFFYDYFCNGFLELFFVKALCNFCSLLQDPLSFFLYVWLGFLYECFFFLVIFGVVFLLRFFIVSFCWVFFLLFHPFTVIFCLTFFTVVLLIFFVRAFFHIFSIGILVEVCLQGSCGWVFLWWDLG